MGPDRWLVEHNKVSRDATLTSWRADALRLASGKGPRRAMEAQVPKPDVIEKADAAERLVENVFRHLAVVRGQLQRLEPGQQSLHWQLGNLGDRATGDAHPQGFRLKLRAMTGRALARRLVLTQKDADVLLVALFLEVAEKGEYSLVPARLPMEQLLALVARSARQGSRSGIRTARILGKRAPLVPRSAAWSTWSPAFRDLSCGDDHRLSSRAYAEPLHVGRRRAGC